MFNVLSAPLFMISPHGSSDFILYVDLLEACGKCSATMSKVGSHAMGVKDSHHS